jgi:hypothetical protein
VLAQFLEQYIKTSFDFVKRDQESTNSGNYTPKKEYAQKPQVESEEDVPF